MNVVEENALVEAEDRTAKEGASSAGAPAAARGLSAVGTDTAVVAE